jgi:hypothetical protein
MGWAGAERPGPALAACGERCGRRQRRLAPTCGRQLVAAEVQAREARVARQRGGQAVGAAVAGVTVGE